MTKLTYNTDTQKPAHDADSVILRHDRRIWHGRGERLSVAGQILLFAALRSRMTNTTDAWVENPPYESPSTAKPMPRSFRARLSRGLSRTTVVF